MLAEQNPNITADFMEVMFDKEQVIISAINQSQYIKEEDRTAFLEKLLSDVIDSQDNILTLFYVAEPNTFIRNTPECYRDDRQ